MFGLGPIKVFVGPVVVAIFGSILFKNVQQMFWSGAPEAVQYIGFRLGIGRPRDTNANR